LKNNKICNICNNKNIYNNLFCCYNCYISFNKTNIDKKLCGKCGKIFDCKLMSNDRNWCKLCMNKNHNYYINKSLYNVRKKEREYYKNNVVKFLFLSAKKRSKRKNIKFDITEAYIKKIYNIICPILNVEMNLDKKLSISPTLDRIHPDKGYIVGNVRVISHKANRAKSYSSKEEYKTLYYNLIKIKDNGVKIGKLKEVNIRRTFYHAKERATKKQLCFDIDMNYIKKIYPENDNCPLLEIPLKKGIKKPIPNSPTIDRIIPELGYVKNNVIIISHKANTMKNNLTLNEMTLLLNNWEKTK